MRAVIAAIRQAIDLYRAQPPLRRESILLGGTLLASLLILPTLIWIAGRFFLGDYLRTPAGTSTGGPLALTVDFISALFSLSLGHWFVLLGPYLLLMAVRAVRAVAKM